jgi:hypothetical protein
MRNSLLESVETIAVVFCATVMLIAFTYPEAVAQSSTKTPAQQETKSTRDQDMMKIRTMMMDGNALLLEGSRKAQQAIKMLKEKGDQKKAESMLADARTLLEEGDKMLTKAQQMMAGKKESKQSMKTMMESCKKMMQGSKIIRSGMIMTKDNAKMSDAERMTKEGHKIVEGEGKKIEPKPSEKAK